MILRELTSKDEVAFQNAMDAWDGDKGFNMSYGLLADMAFESYLKVCNDLKLGLNLKPNEVPATSLYGFVGEVIVGRVSVRHRFNHVLETWGGNIGYGILPEFRGKGYASEMLALSLPYCRTVGLTKVLITCDVTNIASARVIEKNGGVFESIYDPGEGLAPKRRYWISL